MRTFLTLLSNLLVSIFVLFELGSVVAAIWLAILGEWRAIGVGLGLLLTSHFILGFFILLGAAFGYPASKALESGNVVLSVILGSLSNLYTVALVAAWSFLMLSYFHGLSSGSSEIPLLLWSYGAATGPWSFLASKDQQGENPNPGSLIHTFFLSLGYLACIFAILFGEASMVICLMILASFMGISWLVTTVLGICEMVNKNRYETAD